MPSSTAPRLEARRPLLDEVNKAAHAARQKENDRLNAQLLQDLLGTAVILVIGGLAALVIYFTVWP